MDGDARGGAYQLLSATLVAPPDAGFLETVAKLPPSSQQDACGLSLARLSAAAGRADAKEVAEDYQELFIGLGRGRVVPYGSWHITGSMMEKPLAQLRSDLQRMGLYRRKGIAEPEDHAGALCETMAILCAEEAGGEEFEGKQQSAALLSFGRQKTIYDVHLLPWIEDFFAEVVAEAGSDFYRAIGGFGAAFAAFEKKYFAMPF